MGSVSSNLQSLGLLSREGWNWISIIFVAPTLYYLALAAYRLKLHPLARAGIPGPKLAAATWLWEFYYEVINRKKLRPVILRESLRNKYGPVVRINPDEVHIYDKDLYLEVFKMGSKYNKSDRFYMCFASDYSVFNVSDPHDHRQKRAALSPLFSQRAIYELEDVVQDKVEHMLRKMSDIAKEGKTVNFHFIFRAVTIDIVTDFCYAEPYNQLDAPDFKGRHVVALETNAMMLPIFKNIRWLGGLLAALPLWVMEMIEPEGAGNAEMLKAARAHIRRLMLDPSKLNAAKHTTVFQKLLEMFPKADEHTLTYLTQEANTLVTAGSETTASVLEVGLFRILQNDAIHRKLFDELKQAIPNKDEPPKLSMLKQLPYLTACVKESLRVTYGVLGALPRVVPAGGVEVQGYKIPAGTVIGMDSYSLHHDESIYPDSHVFKPERWLNGDADMDRFLASFSNGTRQCIAINLGYAELYMILANVVRRWQLTPYDGFSEADFEYEDVWLHSLPKQNLAANCRSRDE
ncbi:putative Cytochrome P450 [Seiridium cardinale]|uniref:Cytochrome P450 n=1 Tax=Seiridium cardinale TaxID=138064 RepID=A0ABR2XG32_9PEZI